MASSSETAGSPSPSAGAQIVQDIRRRSGLSQAELARRANMPRSVMNAYERSSREPGADTLRRIAAAAGMELEARRSCGMDVHRAGDVLERVLDLAEALPRRRRGQLTYPSPRRHAA